MLLTTLTVDAHQPMGEAAQRIDGIPDDGYVIVRRRQDLELFWYRFRAGFVREMAGRFPEGMVLDVLNLHEGGADSTIQIEDLSDQPDHATGIVLEGTRPLGLLLEDNASTSRGMGDRTTFIEPQADTGADGDDLAMRSDTAADEQVDRTRGDLLANREDEAAKFSAFPRLDAPDHIVVGESLELKVGLASQRQGAATGGAVDVDTEAAEFDLVAQVVADGFSTDRVRDVLHVVRADLAANEARFTLTADPIEQQLCPRILQVDFSYGGELCGRAYRAIVVARDSSLSIDAKGSTMTMPMAISASEHAPDLTITITESDDGTQLEWQFVSPIEGLDLPSTAVRRRFRGHNAKSFAMQQIRLADQSIGKAAVGNKMLGIARTIANQIPSEAWKALTAVWTATKAQDDMPYVLLVSSDPYIPWELASTESDYIDSQLTDRALPPFLGAQLPISRWAAPQPRGTSGILNPPLPPPSRIDVETMTLVIGDYLTMSGQRPLPHAIEEGNILAAKYEALRLTATLDEVDPLFDGSLVREDGTVEPDLVHFACHGQIDPNPGFNGIILNEGNQRLDPLYVAGNKMARPFIFMNACQVGQATQLLDDAGGMAEEFLKTGASGFVAPLWSVDDEVARATAVSFYEEALDAGVPIAEILRRRRAQFDPDISPETTHLAYVYYGHPRLEMAWGL